MTRLDADILVVGSGFAGSLTALILHQLGHDVVVIDRATHPRFAIGESSTPIANMVLRRLADRYDLPQIAPLTKWGTWQAAHPELACGLKRGFSYFKHEPNTPFQPQDNHGNELLVTASADNEHSDTHWLRADVDQFFAEQVRSAGVPLIESTTIDRLVSEDGIWRVSARRGEEDMQISAAFVIDASGAGGVVPRASGIPDCGHGLLTQSRAIYAHFADVPRWHDRLVGLDADTTVHPFCCDDAAQHHILDGAWLWMLRFNNRVTSVGLVLDDQRYPFDPSVPVEHEWRTWIERYPSLQAMLGSATIVDPPGHLIRTPRLQRRWEQIVGANWAALPYTAGFVDPLHSTGIGHTLCGVEKLVEIVAEHWQRDSLDDELLAYQTRLFNELSLIDELVAGCFSSFTRFDLLVSYLMLYFAAATTYEQTRAARENGPSFLCADDSSFREIVTQLRCDLEAVKSTDDQRRYFERVKAAIAPFNHVGLCDAACQNMYRYTAAPE